MPRIRKIAILGGGIMGCSLALELARRGIGSVVFDASDDILSGASRWNEGKIHLGYMYSADTSLATARKILPGGLAFRPIIESLIEAPIGNHITQGDDVFLCHTGSVVPAEGMAGYFRKIDALVEEHPDAQSYLGPLRGAEVRRLNADELRELTGSPLITAGFRVPERSVATGWVADRLAASVRSNRLIELRTASSVSGVEPLSGIDADDRWDVMAGGEREGPFDCVINALWSGRLAIDHGAGVPAPPQWSHRYRLALFLKTVRPTSIASALVAVGPYGDIKNYNGTDLYLSWYPVGLRLESQALAPPAVPDLSPAERIAIAGSMFEALGSVFPAVEALSRNTAELTVSGGWVYAAAAGSLSDPNASIHGRKDFGIQRRGTYLSVDTGKYSTAPWLARTLVSEMISPR